jgi:DeoR/GlpR family transcriptional regulator of sugar metabolism
MIERRAGVLEYIQTNIEVTTEQLFKQFPHITPKTIRRDLTYWERAGAILRSHGKARVNRQYMFQPEAHYSERESENLPAKKALAASAVALLKDRRSLFIDSGTTMMALARHLPDDNLSILTAAPNIAMYITAQKPSCSVLLTGGSLNPKTLSCSGYGSMDLIKLINLEIAFMAASGYTQNSGFTVGEHFECELKRAVIAKAETVVMLMDSSKTGKCMPFTFARPSDIQILVYDGSIDPAAESYIASKGVQIIKSR